MPDERMALFCLSAGALTEISNTPFTYAALGAIVTSMPTG